MKVFMYIDRLNLLHKLIVQRRTGTPNELARRMNISVSRLARIIEFLQNEGAPIKYSRNQTTYYYEYPFEISISVEFNAKE